MIWYLFGSWPTFIKFLGTSCLWDPVPLHGPPVFVTFGYQAGTHWWCSTLGGPALGGRAFVMADWHRIVCGVLSVLPAAGRPSCRPFGTPTHAADLGPVSTSPYASSGLGKISVLFFFFTLGKQRPLPLSGA